MSQDEQEPIMVELVGMTAGGAISQISVELPQGDAALLDALYEAELSPVSAYIAGAELPVWFPKRIDEYDDILALNAIAKIATAIPVEDREAVARFVSELYPDDYTGIANAYAHAHEIKAQIDAPFPEIGRLIDTDEEVAALGRRLFEGTPDAGLLPKVESAAARFRLMGGASIDGARNARNAREKTMAGDTRHMGIGV